MDDMITLPEYPRCESCDRPEAALYFGNSGPYKMPVNIPVDDSWRKLTLSCAHCGGNLVFAWVPEVRA